MKKQIMSLTLFMLMSVDSFALPIAADLSDFAAESNSETKSELSNERADSTESADKAEKNKSTVDWRTLDFNAASDWNYYDRLISELESLFSASDVEDASAETVAAGIDKADGNSVLESAELVSEEFRLVEDFISQTTNVPTRRSDFVEDSEVDSTVQSNTRYLNHGRNSNSGPSLNIHLDSSALLSSVLVEEKKKANLRQRQITERTSLLEALQKLLLALMSPITLLVILLSIILFKLSSAQG